MISVDQKIVQIILADVAFVKRHDLWWELPSLDQDS
jgi:hypothetical protein